MTVVVFGSINLDLVVRTPRLPGAGETVPGHSFTMTAGGKGANQAVACARLGAATRMVGRLGADLYGAMLRDGLRASGVDEAGVVAAEGESSGVALIAVDDAGQNTIVVVPGANGTPGPADLARLKIALEGACALLLQLEIPLPQVTAAAQLARQQGVLVVLDPAPALPLPPELYAAVDLLTPNEHEAAALAGAPVTSVEEAARAARVLRERGARQVVVTLGERGALWDDGAQSLHLPAYPVQVVDTVAAGDAFNGALAAGLAQGLSSEAALRWAMAAGALACTRPGAQAALPTRDELMGFLVPG
jgi:ribokinase